MVTIRRPLFSLNCEARLEAQGQWLADLVSSMEARPPGLRDGVTIEVGWSVLKLIRVGNDLVLHEPDFGANPLADCRPDVSTTLSVLAMQAGLLSRLHCAGATARFDDKLVLQKGCLAEERIYAERTAPAAGDSGWYIGSAAPQANRPTVPELEAIHVHELLRLRPSVLEALALPVGSLVLWHGATLERIADRDDNELFVAPAHPSDLAS